MHTVVSHIIVKSAFSDAISPWYLCQVVLQCNTEIPYSRCRWWRFVEIGLFPIASFSAPDAGPAGKGGRRASSGSSRLSPITGSSAIDGPHRPLTALIGHWRRATRSRRLKSPTPGLRAAPNLPRAWVAGQNKRLLWINSHWHWSVCGDRKWRCWLSRPIETGVNGSRARQTRLIGRQTQAARPPTAARPEAHLAPGEGRLYARLGLPTPAPPHHVPRPPASPPPSSRKIQPAPSLLSRQLEARRRGSPLPTIFIHAGFHLFLPCRTPSFGPWVLFCSFPLFSLIHLLV